MYVATRHRRFGLVNSNGFADIGRSVPPAPRGDLDRWGGQRWTSLVALALLVALIAACSGPADEGASSSTDALATGGRWTLPSDVLSVGAKVRLTYEGAPKWTSAAACGGKLLPGGKVLGGYLMDHYPIITSVGGYSCRRNTANTSQMSVHGTGRALDVMVSEVGGVANSAQGDKIANWLVENAQSIGVDLIIWNRSIWRANGTNASAYRGPIPHTDHLHVELTSAASAKTKQWFADGSGVAADEGAAPDETETADGGADPAPQDPTTPPPADPVPAPADPADDAGAQDPTPVDPPAANEPDASPPAKTNVNSDLLPPKSASADTDSAGDTPGETNSLPDHPARSSPDAKTTPNAGCSAAPGPRGPTRTRGASLALMLGLAAWLRRRRR